MPSTIRDKYTGEVYQGPFELGDDYLECGSCPVCGADPDQQCSVLAKDDSGFGIEISPYIHAERAETSREDG